MLYQQMQCQKDTSCYKHHYSTQTPDSHHICCSQHLKDRFHIHQFLLSYSSSYLSKTVKHERTHLDRGSSLICTEYIQVLTLLSMSGSLMHSRGTRSWRIDSIVEGMIGIVWVMMKCRWHSLRRMRHMRSYFGESSQKCKQCMYWHQGMQHSQKFCGNQPIAPS